MFICILSLVIGFYLNIIAVTHIRKKAELLLPNPYLPLPDIIHNNFPKIPIHIPDYFLFICFWIAIFNYNYLNNIEKNLLCIGICSIIRSFSIFLTIMPTCMPKPNKTENIYTKWFISTHDLMFSGHSIIFISIGNMLNNNFIKIVGPFLLVVARYHYTIDVCVSGLVYFFIYNNINLN
jgi:hypothetical protein